MILRPIRVATSRPARQTYLNSLLFIIASSILFALAVVAYILFYIEYIPQINIERVIHLQYGYVDARISHMPCFFRTMPLLLMQRLFAAMDHIHMEWYSLIPL